MTSLFFFALFLGCSSESTVDTTAPGRCQPGEEGAAGCAAAFEDEADDEQLQLMQLSLKGKARRTEGAAPHLKKLSQDYSFLQGLLKEHAKTKALPANISSFLVAIETNANNVQGSLHTAHGVAVEGLHAAQAEFTTCAEGHAKDMEEAHGKHKAASDEMTVKHCECRKKEAVALRASQGCDANLACYDTRVKNKKADLDNFMADSHCEACAHTDFNITESADDDVAEMEAWLAGRQVECAQHWKSVSEEFEPKVKAHEDAVAAHTHLSGVCEDAAAAHAEDKKECDQEQNAAAMAQCAFIQEVQSHCSVHEQCHTDAVVNWDDLKAVEEKESQSRKDAWEGAEQIKCILGVFDTSGDGDVQIDVSKDEGCDKYVSANCAEHEGCHALDLSVLLDWTKPAPEPCELPEERCQGGAFQPTCGADWGTENQEYSLDQPDTEACDAPGGQVQVDAHDAPLAACTSCDGSEKKIGAAPVSSGGPAADGSTQTS